MSSSFRISEEKQIQIMCLHEAPGFLLPCCELLNEEWPRSLSGRMRSIENSNENFPVSVLLVNNSHNSVLGHAKISRLPNLKDGCWVESVVIRKSERRKGYGRLLMMECENIARLKGLTCAFLSTTDQQPFYKSLGYEECEPINLYGLSTAFKDSSMESHVPHVETPSSGTTDNKDSFIDSTQRPNVAPPPPPLSTGQMFTTTRKTYMKKRL